MDLLLLLPQAQVVGSQVRRPIAKGGGQPFTVHIGGRVYEHKETKKERASRDARQARQADRVADRESRNDAIRSKYGSCPG